jgi:sulfatase maturation enzyme AslB (radical SAM superfamily)
MSWHCSLIDHGLTFYPNDKIGPCCLISPDGLKPASSWADPDRFADLKTATPPASCSACTNLENNGVQSYRQIMNDRNFNKGIQLLDVRNTNQCNLKCRYCGPHFSDKWASELGIANPLQSSSVPLEVITEDLQHIYFTGGEPMMSKDHWDILHHIIQTQDASKIVLKYNTNLTTMKYKNIDIIGLWKQFKRVHVGCSIDAVGPVLDNIRSGSKWETVNNNIRKLIGVSGRILVRLTPVVSIMNIWWLDHLYNYALELGIEVDPIVLSGPDYLALDVIPDELKHRALHILSRIDSKDSRLDHMKDLIQNNRNQDLILHTFSHIMLLDQKRNEKLWQLLPFADFAQKRILENNEYN